MGNGQAKREGAIPYLKEQARRKNVEIGDSFFEEINSYLESLKSEKARELYPVLKNMTDSAENVVANVIGAESIKLAIKLKRPVDREMVRAILDKRKVQRLHIPKDPDSVCWKTVAIDILLNIDEYRESLGESEASL